MTYSVGDLVWIPEKTTLLWAKKEDKVVKKILTTDCPGVALIVSEFDENRFTIFHTGEYWIVDKMHIYEVPDVLNT